MEDTPTQQGRMTEKEYVLKGHRAGGQNVMGYTAESFMQRVQESAREVGGVPLRADYHSAKLARQQQRSPNRGVLANLIGRARHRSPPLHSAY